MLGDKRQSVGHSCPLQFSMLGEAGDALDLQKEEGSALFRDALSECREKLETLSIALEGGYYYSLHITDEEIASDRCGHQSHGEP